MSRAEYKVKVARLPQALCFFIAAAVFAIMIAAGTATLSTWFDTTGTVRVVGGMPVRDPSDETPPFAAGLLWAIILLSPILFSFAVSAVVFRNARWKVIRSDHPMCPNCRYDLTGNISGICPECGNPVEQAENKAL